MTECSCVYVDTDGCRTEFWRERLIKRARRAHTCGECRRQIREGESYLYVSGVWDGDFGTHKVCSDCRSVIDAFFCNGYVFGQVWDDLREYAREAGGDLPESRVAGLTPAALARACELVEECWEE